MCFLPPGAACQTNTQHCVTHPDCLYCDSELHTPVSFFQDKGGASATYLERMERYEADAVNRASASVRITHSQGYPGTQEDPHTHFLS